VRAAAELDVDLLTVHAVGGPAMTGAAVRAVDEVGARTRVLAVTVLTSLGARDLSVVRGRTGVETKDEVERLGQLAARAGAHGAVCSPWEVEALRAGAPPDFLFVTPGIRPAGTDVDDQRRVATPAEAVSAGATHLVVGRAVTRARDPLAALAAVEAEISSSPRHSD